MNPYFSIKFDIFKRKNLATTNVKKSYSQAKCKSKMKNQHYISIIKEVTPQKHFGYY